MGLGLALRYVLDALKKKPGSNMYNFGVVALDRFKHRLREYPQYCQHLATVEHFGQFPRHLVDVSGAGAAGGVRHRLGGRGCACWTSKYERGSRLCNYVYIFTGACARNICVE